MWILQTDDTNLQKENELYLHIFFAVYLYKALFQVWVFIYTSLAMATETHNYYYDTVTTYKGSWLKYINLPYFVIYQGFDMDLFW